MSNYIGRQAVVIGAGMGGLSAARALADYFEQVLVLENDALPASAAPRPGTPQCKHVHGLLVGASKRLKACSQASDNLSTRREPCPCG
jgi:2-polyprenyl-6-methoxyphenol hydroxylase-like FAD-dependent oxidoreductase